MAVELSPGKARSHALRLLKFRPRSEGELRLRLTRKGFSQEIAEAVLAELKRTGLVDDRRFASYFVSQAISSKPVGRRALTHRLRALGVGSELAAQAVEQGTAGQDELQLARAVASKRLPWMTGLRPDALRRRLFGYLNRRGFSGEVVHQVVREMIS